MSNIKLLDDKTINKIAAGEVVERPSSVVKELIENSIDANSSSIIIEIKSGGKKYIRITDNGDGIENDDIDLAFIRHSTSKINSIEDLEKVNSLGFRGEALASIAAVSQVELITKTASSMSGIQVEVSGGGKASKKEVGCPKGTTIIVKNIFFNVPVRRKFLKSDSSEASQISDIIYKLALSNPNISFKYIKDDKLILKTPGKGNLLNTIYSLFGKQYAKSLIDINYNGEDLKVNGMISLPSFTRGNRSHQYLFVNGRYVENGNISRYIENAYKSLVPINRFPIFIVFIETSPDEVDVNVHPNKIEVRFNRLDDIKNKLFKLIKDQFKKKNLIPEVNITTKKKKEEKGVQDNFIDIVKEKKQKETKSNSTLDLSSDSTSNKSLPTFIDQKKVDVYKHDFKKDTDLDINESCGDNYGLNNGPNIINNENKKAKEDSLKNVNDSYNDSVEVLPDIKIIGILFSTYILAQDGNDTFYMIDQHAAHERVMYEKLKNQYEKENVLIQELLAPEIIELTNREIEIVKDNIEIFQKVGFLIEDFGSNSIILRGVPMLFGDPNSKSLFLDILDKLNSEINSGYNLRIEKIMKMSCTSAIKAGDNISDVEVNRLIEDLKKAKEPYTCPHGRPIIIKMSKYEIEKKFKRIQ
ncbi:DNA mismatch repair endonuclease MutL [Dethiothermospora halolimnae]|uniref:DNA mismatch repair endonuclease MutL n=1 Tax=Dethiothermospora halolimnae TaxID=3114390 RepID=UPI003CCC2401